MPEYRREIKFARDTAIAAGIKLKKGLKAPRKVHYKGRVDLVTKFDLMSEKYIVGQIAKTFPGHSIMAEEGTDADNRSEYKWIIDPLDGTTNFAHGYPAFCVSIGLEASGRMVLGVIYDPMRDELFYAVDNKGAFLNKRRIHVSVERRLSRSLLATGFPYDIADSKIDNLENFARMYKASRGIRRGGSAALDLCYLACGRFDGFWELKLHPWDTAAGIVIVQEAGGRVTDLKNGKYSIYDKSILASNAKIHKQMQKVLLG